MQLGRAYQAKIRMMQHRGERVQMRWYRDAFAAFARADELGGGLVFARIEMARTIGARIQSRAGEEFESAVELAKQQGDVDLHLAAAGAAEQFAFEAGMAEMQIWALEEMLEADESRIELWRRLARVSASEGRSADEIYALLLEKRPDDPGAHVLYARHLVGRDRPKDAAEHLEAVIDRDLGSALPWEQLIRVQIQLRRFEEARATFVRMWKKFPKDPLTRQANARLALASGRFADASKMLQGLAGQSSGFETLRLLAVAEFRNGNLDEAAAAIDRALAVNSEFVPEAVRLKAQIHHNARDWVELLRTLNLLAQNGAAMTELDWMMRARAFYNVGQPARGRAALLHLLSKPNPPVGAAIEFAKREGEAQPEVAMTYLLDALARKADEPDIIVALVELDLRAGRLKPAMDRVNASFDAGHAVPRTVLLRASIHMKLGDLEAAEADALRALESNAAVPGGVDALYAIYEAQGRLEEARASFEAAEAAGVLRTGGRLFLARVYARGGDSARAIALYEATLTDEPDISVAKNELAYLLAERNQTLDRALNLAKEAQQSMASDASAADTVGYVYLRKGQHAAALEQFRLALELDRERPSSLGPMLNYHVGLTLTALDRDEEAAEAFRKALAIDPNFPHADDARRRLDASARPTTAARSPS
jgi:tetratricopeptide (TPR) repeat protein